MLISLRANDEPEGSVMAITRLLMTAVVGAGIAVGTASPAAAIEEPPYGVYIYKQQGVPSATWTIYATCVIAGCTLHIQSITSPHLGPNSEDPGYSGDARPVNGRWTLQVTKPDGMTCSDGTVAPVVYTYAFDQYTLAGDRTVIYGPECGKPRMEKAPFTLTYKEPLPIPIILDPLNQIPELW
jgi:hypothetical protein